MLQPRISLNHKNLKIMKTKLSNISNTKILSKEDQKNITGGIWGSTNCLITGCHEHYPGSEFDGIVGFEEGGPCAIASPEGQSCIGTLRQGKCCIGSFN